MRTVRAQILASWQVAEGWPLQKKKETFGRILSRGDDFTPTVAALTVSSSVCVTFFCGVCRDELEELDKKIDDARKE